MGATSIEWTNATWNPVTGCTKVSPGCDHCFAARLASGRLKNHPRYKGLAEDGEWIAPPRHHVRLLDEPLRWRKPRKVFVCDMSDWCHPDVPLSFRLRMLNACAASQSNSIFQFLTKRPEEMAATFTAWYKRPYIRCQVPHPRFWLGVTVEDQQRANERIPVLLQISAAVHFVSLEPLLGPVDVAFYLDPRGLCGEARQYQHEAGHSVGWVIAGCESGPCRRPAEIDCFRSLRDQCVEAGVPFFLKQMEVDGKIQKTPLLDERMWAEYPHQPKGMSDA